MNPRRLAVPVILVGILAFGIRFACLEQHSTLRSWDEVLSIYTGIGGFPDDISYSRDTFFDKNTIANVASHTIKRDSGNALGYHLALHYWFKIFGFGETTAGMLSTLASGGVVILGMLISIELFQSKNAAISTGALLAVQPVLCTFSPITRSYALGSFFVLAAMLALIRIDKATLLPGPKILSLYTALITAGLFSHYLTIYALGLQAGCYILCWGPRDKRSARIIACWLAALSLLALWLFVLAPSGINKMQKLSKNYWLERIREGKAKPFYQLTTPSSMVWSNLFWATHSLGYGGYWYLVGFYKVRYLILPLLAIIATSAYLFLARIREEKNHRNTLIALALAMSSALFSNSASLLAGHNVSFLTQYSNFGLPFIAILLGSVCTGHSKPWRRRLGSAVLLISLTLSILTLAIRRKEESRPNPYTEIAQRIIETNTGNSTVYYGRLDDAYFVNLQLYQAGYQQSVRQEVIPSTSLNRYVSIGPSAEKAREIYNWHGQDF